MKLIIPPPAQGLMVAAIMWAVDRSLPGFSLSAPALPYLAAAFMVTGLVIELIAVAAFVRARTTVSPFQPSKTKALVTTGLYRVSRNPMYLGMALLLSGWAIWLGNPLNIAALGAFIASITLFQIKPEEAVLREKFCEAYEAYCRRVRRWI